MRLLFNRRITSSPLAVFGTVAAMCKNSAAVVKRFFL